MPWMIGHQPRGKQNDCDEIKQNILALITPVIKLGERIFLRTSFILLYYYAIKSRNLKITVFVCMMMILLSIPILDYPFRL